MNLEYVINFINLFHNKPENIVYYYNENALKQLVEMLRTISYSFYYYLII